MQTRNSRYGRLQNGVLACVPSVYVRRQAQHLVNLPRIGVMVVLGNNGWVWVCVPPRVAGSGRQETINFSQMDVRYQKVHPEMTPATKSLVSLGQTMANACKRMVFTCISMIF